MKNPLICFLFLPVLCLSCTNNTSEKEDGSQEKDAVTLAAPPAIDPKNPADYGVVGPENSGNVVRFTPPVIARDEEVQERTSRSGEILNPAGKNPITQKLIRTGSISIESNALNESKMYLDRQLHAAIGYYETESFENNRLETFYQLKARIPSGSFDSFLKSMRGAGGIIWSRNIQIENITAEYIDVESRLATKRIYRDRYKELAGKAGKISDLLAIEESTRTLQEEIESTETQLRTLQDQVHYSTLDIRLFKKSKHIKSDDSFGVQLQNAFRQSGENLQSLLFWGAENWMVLLMFAGGIWWPRRQKFWPGRKRISK